MTEAPREEIDGRTSELPLPERARGLSLLGRMMLVRRFEELAAELYSAGKIRGFLHLCVGEEAASVGAIDALPANAKIVATYREHGQAIARGVPLGPILAEMYGKLEGTSRGRGGSMHLFDVARGFLGGNAIVAGHLPLAVGLGLADRMQERRGVTACFFGDGAVAEGEFHESLNLAALWHLPVIFVCENNRYAMGTAITRFLAQTDLCRKAAAEGVFAERVDGMDVLAVSAAMHRAVERATEERLPTFLELETYRFRAHSMFDAELYRQKAEVEAWRKHCPIAALEGRLRAAGLLDDADVAALRKDVDAKVNEAVAFAEAGTLEGVDQLLFGVTTEPAVVAPEAEVRR